MKRTPLKRTGFKSNVSAQSGILRTATLPDLAKIVKPRMRKCAICKTPFRPFNALRDKWCSVECGAALGIRLSAAKAAKLDRADVRARKEAIKPRAELIAETQTTFNAYIRERDKYQTCIDCGKPFEPQKQGGSIDAGHYLSRGSAGHLRFDERNCFAQRKNCNRPGGTTREAFRAGVEARIGIEALEALEATQEICKWTHDDLRMIKRIYQLKLKDLRAARAEKEAA